MRNRHSIPGVVIVGVGLAATTLTSAPALASEEYNIVCGDYRIFGDLNLSKQPVQDIQIESRRESYYCLHY